MSIEHRRQLLAFFVVALAAVLLIGNGLHNRFPDRTNDRPGNPAIIASGPTFNPGPSSVELGGSARGTTTAEPARVPVTSDTTTARTSTSRTSPVRTGPGHSDGAQQAPRAVQRSSSSAKEPVTQRSARTAYRSGVLAQRGYASASRSDTSATGHGNKAHAKKHGKKHARRDHR